MMSRQIALGDRWTKRVVVLGAGGPAGINFIRSLRAAPKSQLDVEVIALDSNPVHLELVEAHRRLPMPRFDVEAVARLEPDLVHAQPDPLVVELATSQLPAYVPSVAFLELAQDKLESARVWAKAGLCTEPEVASFRADLYAAEKRVGYPLWIRARHGAGAKWSSPAPNRDVAGSWVNYLVARFGATDLIVQPYLPGRDYGVTTLWWRGALLAILCRERLEYLYPQHAVSGRTGTPVVARLIRKPEVESVAVDAILALSRRLDETPHGVMCVDLRCDASDRPVPTEINAGRFFTTSNCGLGVGLNIPLLYAQVALGIVDPAALSDVASLPPEFDGTLFVRHIDAPAVWIPPERQSAPVRDAVEWMTA